VSYLFFFVILIAGLNPPPGFFFFSLRAAVFPTQERYPWGTLSPGPSFLSPPIDLYDVSKSSFSKGPPSDLFSLFRHSFRRVLFFFPKTFFFLYEIFFTFKIPDKVVPPPVELRS